MKRISISPRRSPQVCPRRVRCGGFTLQEVVFSTAIAGIAIAGMMTGHSVSSQRAQWTTYSNAAQSFATQRLEQTRAARWDPYASPAVDELIAGNFPAQTDVLDIPIMGTNTIPATNVTTITAVSSSPPLRMVQVDCSWGYPGRGTFTNTIVTYRSPDQ